MIEVFFSLIGTFSLKTHKQVNKLKYPDYMCSEFDSEGKKKSNKAWVIFGISEITETFNF